MTAPRLSPDPDHNLAAAVHHHARTRPDALAVAASGRGLTYAQLAAEARRIAAALRDSPAWRASAASGDTPRVAVLAARGVDACVAILGAAWAGAGYVPIGPGQPDARIVDVLGQAAPVALIADHDGAARLGAEVLAACPALVLVPGDAPARRLGTPVRSIESLPAVEAAPPAPVAPEAPAYVIFTSGTTGSPKGVVIRNAAVRHAVHSFAAHLGLRPDDRVLESCEPTFDFSVHDLFSTWQAGASVHVLPRSRVLDAVRFVRESGITVWNSVPSLIGLLERVRALAPDSLPTLRVSVFCGEQLSLASLDAWRRAAPGSEVHNLYGPTEATVFCTGLRVREPALATPGRDWLSIGRALPGCRMEVFDTERRAVADGEPGELAVAGVQLSDGYLGRPELTAARFPTIDGERWYLTGDRAMRDADGQLHWLGRIDHQVKILGHRVELEEIDAHLRAVAGTALAGSVAWPEVAGGATGAIAFVGRSEADPERIREAMRSRLPSYMVPTRVVALDALPLNSNGKVDRGALRRLLETGRV